MTALERTNSQTMAHIAELRTMNLDELVDLIHRTERPAVFSHYDSGMALWVIHQEKLWPSSMSWEDWCLDVIGYSRAYVGRLIAYYEVARSLQAVDPSVPLPVRTIQLESLAKMRSEIRMGRWQAAIASAPNGEIHQAIVTKDDPLPMPVGERKKAPKAIEVKSTLNPPDPAPVERPNLTIVPPVDGWVDPGVITPIDPAHSDDEIIDAEIVDPLDIADATIVDKGIRGPLVDGDVENEPSTPAEDVPDDWDELGLMDEIRNPIDPAAEHVHPHDLPPVPVTPLAPVADPAPVVDARLRSALLEISSLTNRLELLQAELAEARAGTVRLVNEAEARAVEAAQTISALGTPTIEQLKTIDGPILIDAMMARTGARSVLTLGQALVIQEVEKLDKPGAMRAWIEGRLSSALGLMITVGRPVAKNAKAKGDVQ